MLKKIIKMIKEYYSINDNYIQLDRNIDIVNIDNNTIILTFPHGILGENVILREENNLDKLEFENKKNIILILVMLYILILLESDIC